MSDYLSKIWPCGHFDDFQDALIQAFKVDSSIPEFSAAAEYACSGGKQIRPALLLAVANAYRINFSEVLPFMLALELIHNYSLVHDDLPAMDNDSLRHGKASCHLHFGEAKAILIGDYLLNRAYEILLNTVSTPARQAAAMRIAKAAGGLGMIAGQLRDLAVDLKSRDNLTSLEKLSYLREVEEIQDLKTGALIRAAVLVPLDLVGAGSRDYKLWTSYASDLGKAYQIKDDILDCTASEQDLGKSIGKDERDEKLTASRILGLAGAEEYYAQLCRGIEAVLSEISTLIALDARAIKSISSFILERNF